MSASQRSDQVGNPVLVELHHGPHVESVHRGVAAVANAKGEIIWSLGQIEETTCIRSALKPLQALALLETGTAEALRLSDAHLAIACGSHSGEPKHVELVGQWLTQLGLSQTDLGCGCSRPLDAKAHEKLLHDHHAPSALHHNCSGKHAGFLSIATHLGLQTETYLEPDHQTQKHVLACLEAQLDRPISPREVNVDGCSAPNIFAPFQVFASAFGRFIHQDASSKTTQNQKRILTAMVRHPNLVSGHNRFSYRLNQSVNGKIIGKSGAEGSYLAMIPEAGLSILLKIDDGAKRAAQSAILAILSRLGLLGQDVMETLRPKFRSSRSEIIGHFAATPMFRDLTPDLIPKGR